MAESPRYRRMGTQIYPNVTNCIGSTPMVRLTKISVQEGIQCELLAKCEFMNPGGSHKDRPACLEIERAMQEGKVGPNTTIVAPTTGNAGISLAMICAVRGFRCVLVMPDKMGEEKMNIMNALGVHVVRAQSVTDESSPDSYQNVAKRLASQMSNVFFLDQYGTQDNPDAHYISTGVEILEGCEGRLDAVVIAAGSCATVTGVGRRMKQYNPSIQVVAVHTQGSTLDQEHPTDSGEKVIEGGVGHTFHPDILDRSVIDRWIKISNYDTFSTARRVIREEGILCGGSSGAVVAAAIQVAKELGPGKRCVAILGDGVRNYLRQFLSDDWFGGQGWPVDETSLPDRPMSDWQFKSPAHIGLENTVDEAHQKLHKEDTDYLLVADKQGSVVGVVSQVQLGHALPNQTLTSVKLVDFAPVNPQTSVRDAATQLKRHLAVLLLKKAGSGTKPKVDDVSAVISSVTLATNVLA